MRPWKETWAVDGNYYPVWSGLTGKGTCECDDSELEFLVGVSSTIPCSSKRLNVGTERREATLFYYSRLNVRVNVS